MIDTDKNRVLVYDTTLRDGTQAKGVNFTLSDKLKILQMLDDLGVDYVEGGYPLSNPKDEQFFHEAAKLDLKHTKVAAFGMTRRKGIAAKDDVGMNALLDSGAPVVTIVGKSWDFHVREVLRVDEAENLQMIADSVAIMVENEREMIYDAEHFFDGYKANDAFAMATLQAAVDAGASCLALCDTNGGASLAEMAEFSSRVVKAFPSVNMGIHCHNDSDIAVANSLMAVRHGARMVQGTINGIGERCGNADLVSICANLSLKYGYDVLESGAIPKLTEVSRQVYDLANLDTRTNQPFVGSGAFAHKGGMHVHAIQRNPETYEHIAPEAVGNTRRVLVSELSGVSNIAATMPEKFGLEENKEAQREILKRVMELESEGYEFEAAEASFELLIRDVLGGEWNPTLYSLNHYRCSISRHGEGESSTEATVKLTMDGKSIHTVAEAHGPVDSLKLALSAALRECHPAVDDLHLLDYRVRVIDIKAETAAKVRVVIEWHDASSATAFGTVGVDENIIDASWRALDDAVRYKLLNA